MAGAPPPGLDRKRGPGDFGGGGDGGWRKRPRFDEAGVPPATLRVLVRNQDAGGIIGKGGENIKRLRKQYDCQVMLPDSAGAPERVMTMMGSIESCLGVFADVINTLGLDSGLGDNAHKEVQILIPQPFMGTIIGTGGAKIKELRGRTSAKIKIFMEPMPNSNERSIQIIGVHDQIVDCTRHFLQEIGKVRKKEPREPIFLYEPGAPSFGGDFPPPGRGGFPGRGRGGGGGGGGPSRGQGNFGGDGGGGGNWRGGRGGGRGRGGRGGGRGRGGMNGQRGGGGYNQSNQFNPNPPQGGGFGAGGVSNPPPAVGYSQAPPPAVGYDQPPPPMGGPPPMPQGMGAGGGQPPAFPQPPQLLSQQPPRQTQQVTIPSEYAEAIMGVGGGNLAHIKSQSNCDINIDPPKPGTNERIITIIGGSADIGRAQQLLQKSVRDKFPNV